MAFRILVSGGGYNVVTSLEKAREYIKAYRDAGLYAGTQLLPWYKGGETWG